MAMVQGKSLKYRVWATHIAMWAFLALIIFPFTDDHRDFIP